MLLATVSEATFQRWVISTARRNSWLVHHVHDSRKEEWGTDAGFPDLVLARGGRVLFVELKTNRGRPSTAQLKWWSELPNESDGDQQLYVWRPTDEAEIEKVLA
jgi:hypothetical protein